MRQDAPVDRRALGDALLLAMQNFSRDVLVPALASRNAPGRVRNVVVHVHAAVDEAAARACAAATTVLLVEPAEVAALRAELSQPGEPAAAMSAGAVRQRAASAAAAAPAPAALAPAAAPAPAAAAPQAAIRTDAALHAASKRRRD